MREIEKRLARLEALFGHRDCICSTLPGVMVVDESGKTEEEIGAEIAERQTRCPVHGPMPDMIVQLRRFADAA